MSLSWFYPEFWGDIFLCVPIGSKLFLEHLPGCDRLLYQSVHPFFFSDIHITINLLFSQVIHFDDLLGDQIVGDIRCTLLRIKVKKERRRIEPYLETISTTVSSNWRNTFQGYSERSTTGRLNIHQRFGTEINLWMITKNWIVVGWYHIQPKVGREWIVFGNIPLL